MNNILLAVLVFLSANGALAEKTEAFPVKSHTSPLAKRAQFDQLLEEHFAARPGTVSPGPKSNAYGVRKHTEEAKLVHRQDLVKGRRAAKQAKHTVVIAVKQRGLKELEAHLNDVSNPKSRNFGKHLTKEQVTQRTANPKAAKHVVKHLTDSGFSIVKTTKHKEYITVEGTVSQWEDLLSTEFFEFSHEQGTTLLRAEHYTLPEHFEEHVSAVFNTVQFPDPNELVAHQKVFMRDHKASQKGLQGQLIAGVVTPQLLNNYYNITTNTGNGLASQSVYESLNQSYSPSDLSTFQTTFSLPAEQVAFDIGGHAFDNACVADKGANCGEANLDVQYIMAVSQATPTTYYYWTGAGFVTEWVQAMVEEGNPPLVNSISYSSYEYYMSQSSSDAFNTEAMKLLALGATLFSASGDDGVAGYMARGNPIMCGYYPQFPATSPYVTAVGGSQGPEDGTTEIACQSQLGGVITTGGGFSNLNPTPAWQATQVAAYFTGVDQTNSAPYQGYNAGGRGYPDVTLAASTYYVVMNGKQQNLYGTSASTPVFAAMVSLVNARRLAANKTALGWINPSLYALSSQYLLNDIDSGINNCVANAEVCCEAGFYATAGWDPVTGLGSVNYGKFEDVFFALGDLPDQPFPTAAPTVNNPALAPTAAPNMAAGWVYDSFHLGTDCAAAAATQIGFATQTCFKNYIEDESGDITTVSGSVMYQCNGVTATRIEYSDENCTTVHDVDTYFIGCATSVESYYAAETYSNSLSCTTNQAIYPVPLTGSYAIDVAYNQGGCLGTPAAYEADLENFCFNYGGTRSGISYKYSWPYYYIYSKPNCKKQVQAEVISGDVCYQAQYYPTYDDYYGYQGQEVGTFVLTTKFTQQTTADNYQFTAYSLIEGISATQYTANQVPNDNTVIYAATQAMPGITSNNVAVISVQDSPSRRALLASLRGLATSSVWVGYTVNYNYAQLGYTNNTAAYNYLTTSLSNSLGNGVFTNALNSYAAANNVQDMTNVTSTELTYTESTNLTPADDSDDKSSGLSKGALAGIIIGSVLGAILLCGCVWFFFFRGASSSGGGTSKATATATPAPAEGINPVHGKGGKYPGSL